MSDEAKALYQRMFNGLASLQTMGEHDKELFRLVYIQEITRALHAERVKGMEQAAKCLDYLIGKDCGNWNRAIIQAQGYIRNAKAQESP